MPLTSSEQKSVLIDILDKARRLGNEEIKKGRYRKLMEE